MHWPSLTRRSRNFGRLGLFGALLAAAVFALTSCANKPSVAGGQGSLTLASSPGHTPADGRALFFKNCVHCHGADARGNEGPDLHQLDESDEWIAGRIRNGKKGEMPAFGAKLQPGDVQSLVAYLRTLNEP